MVNVVIHPIGVMGELLDDLFRHGSHGFVIGLLFGGDRLNICDELAVAYDDNGQLGGLATFAPEGESGHCPTIEGLWVRPDLRRRGYGTALLLALVSRGLFRGFDPPFRIDCVTPGALHLVNSLPKNIRAMIKVYDFSDPDFEAYIQ